MKRNPESEAKEISRLQRQRWEQDFSKIAAEKIVQIEYKKIENVSTTTKRYKFFCGIKSLFIYKCSS